MTPNPNRAAYRRRIPDKWLAVALFLLLLGLYLWRHDDTIKQMMFTAFGLLCVAISDGLRRAADYYRARMARESKKPEAED
jgi:hypothetical protein